MFILSCLNYTAQYTRHFSKVENLTAQKWGLHIILAGQGLSIPAPHPQPDVTLNVRPGAVPSVDSGQANFGAGGRSEGLGLVTSGRGHLKMRGIFLMRR